MADFYAARAGTNAGAPLDGFLTAVHTFSDRGYILDSGRIVLTDTGANLLANEEMGDVYIGRGHGAGSHGSHAQI